MIERMPLDIFGDRDADEIPAPSADADAAAPEPSLDPPASTGEESGSFIVSCQWCGEPFENEMDRCPHCSGVHARLASPDEDDDALSCQWCLATIEAGIDRCPECGGRIVVPGQFIAGMNEPATTLAGHNSELRLQQSRSQQMVAELMTTGGLDALVGGLIGIALSIFDD